MEWKDGVLTFREDEIDQGTCAPNPKWGASQLRAYGVDVVMKSEKLRPILMCSKVLELAGVDFVIETAEKPEAEEPAAVATAEELVQAEAPDGS